jgi:hypothetical protein
VDTNGDGAVSATSSTRSVCTVDPGDGLTVTYVGARSCGLTAHVAAGRGYTTADGELQSLRPAAAPGIQ